MKIKFHTNILNDLIDTPEIITPDNLTLKQLFHYFIERHGESVRTRLFENDTLRPNVLVLLNGKNVNSEAELETNLHDGDFLAVITTIVGG